MRILSIRVWHDLCSSRSILATKQKAVRREEQKQDQLEARATARAEVGVVVQQWEEEDILRSGLDFRSKTDRTAEGLNVEF